MRVHGMRFVFLLVTLTDLTACFADYLEGHVVLQCFQCHFSNLRAPWAKTDLREMHWRNRSDITNKKCKWNEKENRMKTGFFVFFTFLVGNHLLLHPVLKDNSGKVKWGLGDCNCCDCDFFTPQVTYSNFFLPLKSAVFKMELHKIFCSSHYTLLHLAGQQGWRFDCIIPALLKWRYPQFWLTTFAGFHCVGCFTWQRASVAGPQTDPTHTRSEQIFDSTLLWLLFWNIPQQSTVNLPLRLRLNTHTHTL